MVPSEAEFPVELRSHCADLANLGAQLLGPVRDPAKLLSPFKMSEFGASSGFCHEPTVGPCGRAVMSAVKILQTNSGAYWSRWAKNFNAAGWQQQFLVV
jgi:hypothetical protein